MQTCRMRARLPPLRPADGGVVGLAISGPDTVEEWAELITTEADYESTEPQAVDLDGAAGVVLDVQLAPGVDPGDAPPLFDDVELSWDLGADNQSRVWIVQHPDEALMIVTRASDADFEAWADSVTDILGTLQWAE